MAGLPTARHSLGEGLPYYVRAAVIDAKVLKSITRLEAGGPAEWEGTLVCEDLYPSSTRHRFNQVLDYLGKHTCGFGGDPSHQQLPAFEKGREVFSQPPGAASDTQPLLLRLQQGGEGGVAEEEEEEEGGGGVRGEASSSSSSSIICRKKRRVQMCITLSPVAVAFARSKGCIYVDRDHSYYKAVLGKRKPEQKHGRHSWMSERAHRLVLWCAYGPPPSGEEKDPPLDTRRLALHMCGNPSCLNPEHLVWGNHTINAITDPKKAAAEYTTLLQEQNRLPALPPPPPPAAPI